MENTSETTSAATASETCATRAGGGLLNRRTLYTGLGIGAAAGLFLGWDWLVAIGAASVLLALAPCLVMCALGLCAMRRGQNKNNDIPARSDATKTNPLTGTTSAHETAANATGSTVLAANDESAQQAPAAATTGAPRRPSAAV